MISRREAVLVTGLAVSAISAKIGLLLTSQSALDSDEAIVGLMAAHISQGKSHPLFFYGQSYDAGAGVLAHIAAYLFALHGISPLVLKIVALGVWLGMALATALVMRRSFGTRAAGIAAILVLWAPSSVAWAMKARGGHMLAVLFVVAMLGFAFSEARNFWISAAIGALGAAAVWCQPSVFPAAALIVVWIVGDGVRQRRLALVGAPVLAAVALSALPMAFMRASAASWSWEALVGSQAGRSPAVIFSSLIPGIFTPELDGLVPPVSGWVLGAAYVWLLAVLAGLAALAIALFKKTIAADFRRPAAMLLAVTCVAPLSGFMVDSQYARPRHILIFYPLACMAVAAGIEIWRRQTSAVWPEFIPLGLVLIGAAVHLGYIGPPIIHGAGEQEVAVPADTVEHMIADLDAHNVRCVFSESPMLQWNLMFASRERIAARWTAPRDRWQPYVERVNEAFKKGESCALLLKNVPAGLKAQQLTSFGSGYALLYDPPRKFITEHFIF